jgi:hypothetical protein
MIVAPEDVGPMSLDDYLAIPYVLDVSTVAGPDGDWVCRVAYGELPGCVAEDRWPLAALDRLEALRERYIRSRVDQGLPVPTPRPPLRV